MKQYIERSIAMHGYMVLSVGATVTVPEFAHTIGLSEMHGHAELIAFGLPMETAYMLLSDLAERIKAGQVLADGEVIDDVGNFPVALRRIPQDAAARHAGALYKHYAANDSAPAVMQVVLTDERGKFPWQPECSPRLLRTQPELWQQLH